MTDAELVLRSLAASDRPRTIEDLALATGIPRREVEAAIQSLRLDGKPIVTDGRGVKLSTDPDEVARAAESLKRRLVTQYAGVRALRRTARRMRSAGLTLFGDL